MFYSRMLYVWYVLCWRITTKLYGSSLTVARQLVLEPGHYFTWMMMRVIFCKFGLLFRLVLNHLGYFNPSALKESLTSAVPRVVALSSDQEDFGRDLNSIDEISAKTGVLQTQVHFHFMTFKDLDFCIAYWNLKKDPNNAFVNTPG